MLINVPRPGPGNQEASLHRTQIFYLINGRIIISNPSLLKLLHLLGCQLDRIHNMLITCTTTQIARKSVTDFIFRWVRILFQEGNHASLRCPACNIHIANHALPRRPAGTDEDLIYPPSVGRSQTFNSGDLMTICLDCKHQT